MTRNVNVITLAQIDLIKGRSNADLDKLASILLDNYDVKFNDDPTVSISEDSFCPSCDIVDDIIKEMCIDFEAVTGEQIYADCYWGHIHERNMSTNTHNHNNTYVAGVLYVQVPEGSGSISFRPRLNPYDGAAYASSFKPEKGVYYIFPGYLDHFVSRHKSDEKRISISFNFKRKNPD